MGAGISVRNESDVPLLVVCSQLTPLHWGKCLPGETWNAKNEQKMGKVWFTVSVGVYDHTQEPDGAKVALRIATITAATVLSGGLVGVGVVGTASALTSTMGVKRMACTRIAVASWCEAYATATVATSSSSQLRRNSTKRRGQ